MHPKSFRLIAKWAQKFIHLAHKTLRQALKSSLKLISQFWETGLSNFLVHGRLEIASEVAETRTAGQGRKTHRRETRTQDVALVASRCPGT